MNIFQKYKAFVKDNPKHLWFKRKWYGWGWTPVTWQGWSISLLYVILIMAFALTIDDMSPPREIVLTFILPVTLLTITFIRIAYKTGEKPKWQWGGEDKEDTDR